MGWEPLPDTVRETAAGGIPLAQGLSKGPAVGRVVGREEEQDLLLDAFKRVVAGEGREVVFVSGEPGIGKTTLVSALARTAYDLGACVLWGHFDEEGSIPYRGVAEALAHYVVHAPEEVLQQHLDEDGAVLAMLVPALSRRIPNLPPDRSADPETQRFLLFSSVVNLVARAATPEAMVLVLDDLQWADEPSLQLLRHLITSSRGQRLLIVGTCRDAPGRADAFTQFLAAMRREQGSSFVELSCIDEAAVLSFLEGAAGKSLGSNGERLARFLHHETDGNPFFVSEMLRHLSEIGTFFQDADGEWQARHDVTTMDLPSSIRQVVRARVERLGEQSSRLLSLAAMIGREFDLDVLSAASESDEDDVLDLLDAALAAGLVVEVGESPGRYRFAHALIGHTLDQDLGATRRARLHRKVAAALEDLCREEFGHGPLDITGWESWSTIRQRRLATRVGHLAHQWTATGDPADAAAAAAYCTRAGQIALRVLAPHEALRWFRQAAELRDRLGEHDALADLDVSIGLGTAMRRAGDPAHREMLLGAARSAQRLGETSRLVAAALMNIEDGWPSSVSGDSDRVSALEAALDAVGDGPSANRARLLSALCCEISFGTPLEQRLRMASEAQTIARSLDDTRVVVEVANRLAVPLEVPETFENRLIESAEILPVAEELRDPVLLFWALSHRSVVSCQAGLVDEAERCVTRMHECAVQLGHPFLRFVATTRQATILLLRGRLNESEQLADAALALGTELGRSSAFELYSAQLANIRAQQGRLHELVPLLEQILTTWPDDLRFRGTMALAHCEAGRVEAARDLLEESLVRVRNWPKDPTWLMVAHQLADVAVRLGHREAAPVLLEALRPWIQQIQASTVVVTGPVAHFVGGLAGVMGCFAEAEAAFAQSLERSLRQRASFFAARTELEWGRMLVARAGPEDGDRARQLLEKAKNEAREHGYANLEARAEEALSGLS